MSTEVEHLKCNIFTLATQEGRPSRLQGLVPDFLQKQKHEGIVLFRANPRVEDVWGWEAGVALNQRPGARRVFINVSTCTTEEGGERH